MNALKAFLVDDEPLARQRLARMLEELGTQVVGTCQDVTEFLEALKGDPEIDVLFLDVEMPGANGLEALAELPRPLPVVFVTAHPQHAARAFEADAVDYLVKPVFRHRLEKTLDKVERHRRGELPLAGAPEPSPAAKALKLRFPAKAAGGTFFLDARRVSHFEFEDYAVWAWVAGQRFRAPWESLGEVEEALTSLGLLRIQRHLLVRPEAVLSMRGLVGGRVALRLAEGPELEVSRSMTPRVRERLGLGRE